MSAQQIGVLLKNEKIIGNNIIFNLLVKVSGLNKKIQAGEYSFYGELTVVDVIKILEKSKFYYRKITIPECFTVSKTLELLNSNIFLTGKIKGKPDEGSIFPDTYFFLRNEKRNKLVNIMKRKMNVVVNEVMKDNKTQLKSKEEVIKLASIINAETKINSEKYLVASVFHNRLKKNMRLQSDPTILYAINLNKKKEVRKIYKKNLKSDNPWNTYTRNNLPLTAICNPGLVSLQAAIKPASSNFYYFVSDGEGGHKFSSNLKDHRENIKLWKKKLLETNAIK